MLHILAVPSIANVVAESNSCRDITPLTTTTPENRLECVKTFETHLWLVDTKAVHQKWDVPLQSTD